MGSEHFYSELDALIVKNRLSFVLVIGMLGVQLHINHELLLEKRKICLSAKHEDQM